MCMGARWKTPEFTGQAPALPDGRAGRANERRFSAYLRRTRDEMPTARGTGRAGGSRGHAGRFRYTRPMDERGDHRGEPYRGDSIRREIAAEAARLIADSALDYGSAKRKAARRVFGNGTIPKGAMPDNDEIDVALREHLDLFDEEHPRRRQRRGRVALALMTRLSAFSPYATGAVWKGIVAEHAPIHLQLFHDNTKDVEIDLLNDGIDFEVATIPHFRGTGEVEALAFEWHDEPVLLSLYDSVDLRGALKAGDTGAQRGDRNALARRLAAAEAAEATGVADAADVADVVDAAGDPADGPGGARDGAHDRAHDRARDGTPGVDAGTTGRT